MAPAVFVLNYVFKINVALLIAGSVFICILKAGLARMKERRTS